MITFKVTKAQILENFAKRIPNAEKMLVDWGRDSLLVQFDGIHSKEFKISEILEKYKKAVKAGYQVEIV